MKPKKTPSKKQVAKGQKPRRLAAVPGSADIYTVIGDLAARLHFSWSWGRIVDGEQEWAAKICKAIGIEVKECPLPDNLQGEPMFYRPVVQPPQPIRDGRHVFVPNKKYPWFCGICGYAPHEMLMHLPNKEQPDQAWPV